jgi:hypothetical protein
MRARDGSAGIGSGIVAAARVVAPNERGHELRDKKHRHSLRIFGEN